SFELNSDRIHAREQRLPMAPEVTSASIGPTGKRVAIEAHGQIWSIAAENGDARLIENHPGSRALSSVWSPDGKKIAFIGDRSGEYQVWIEGGQGGEPKKLTTDLKGEFRSLVWSPVGKWLATTERSTAILLINAETGA